MKKKRLTYEDLKAFLDNYEPTSIAWNLDITENSVELVELGIAAFCRVNLAGITQLYPKGFRSVVDEVSGEKKQ